MSGRTLTTNRNLLSPSKFRLVINSTKYENVEFFCVSAPLPGFTLPNTPVGVRGATMYVPGDKIQYDDITFKILVDEDLKNYSELYNWIKDNHSSGTLSYEDIILQIYSSSSNKNKEIKFVSSFPVSISAIQFDTQVEGIDYLSIDVTFRYDRFQIL
jgi:hypothetical protein